LKKIFSFSQLMIWLSVLVLTIIVGTICYHVEKKEYTSEAFTQKIQKHFSKTEQRIIEDRASGKIDSLDRKFNSSFFKVDYGLFIVKDSDIVYWNTVGIDLSDDIKQAPEQYVNGNLVALTNATCYVQSWPQDSLAAIAPTADTTTVKSKRYIITLIPITYHYPLNNQYFQSFFVADKNIPSSTDVLPIDRIKDNVITDNSGKAIFTINYHQSASELYKVSPFIWVLLCLAFICFIVIVNNMSNWLAKKYKNSLLGLGTLITTLLFFYFLITYLPAPVGFQNAPLFDPELYSTVSGAQSVFNVMVSVGIQTWMLFYALFNIPFSKWRLVRNRKMDIVIRIIACFGIVFFILYYISHTAKDLILDSKISFEITNIETVNLYTIIGLVVIVFTCINVTLYIAIVSALLSTFTKGTFRRLVVSLLILLVTSFFLYHFSKTFRESALFNYIIVIGFLLDMLLIDIIGLPIKKHNLRIKKFSLTSSYIWFAFICLTATYTIFHYNSIKEKSIRIAYAKTEMSGENGFLDFTLFEIGDQLQKDTIIAKGFYTEESNAAHVLNNYINYQYLYNLNQKYNIKTTFYNAQHQLLPYDVDVTQQNAALQNIAPNNKTQNGSGTVSEPNITVKKYSTKIHENKSKQILGTILFEISILKQTKTNNQREYLNQTSNATDQQYYDDYAYAIYKNNRIWKQSGNGNFPYFHKTNIPIGQYDFTKPDINSSLLEYNNSVQEHISVLYQFNLFSSFISLFSFVLIVVVSLGILYWLIIKIAFLPYRVKYLKLKLNFTIRNKVNIAILLTVFISFVTVGLLTTSYIGNRYKEGRLRNLESLMLYYVESVSDYAYYINFNFTDHSHEAFVPYSIFNQKLKSLAEEHGADISLYNKQGKIIATSLTDLYRIGLFSHQMPLDVLQILHTGNQPRIITHDKLGALSFQSIYAPIRDAEGQISGYINIPYHSFSKMQESEMSAVLLSLLNVYTLIFFISGIGAILISNSIVRSFNLLIHQFRTIKLKHNEYIEWPYKDEIRILVKEYNLMLRHVEGMASRLASTEREAAWREIAKQVAHEIKNPLTPMKLSIQYLQQAMDAGRSDVQALTQRVSQTLIDQIEHLNIIATEFSNFAKMPEANPEEVNVVAQLNSLVSLFQQEQDVQLTIDTLEIPLMVWIDKGHFIRVFTNLIKNAIQALDKEEGWVRLQYSYNEQEVEIAISDNGSGMSEEVKQRLFIPYFTTKNSGTGIGLAMCKNMIEFSNGSIRYITELEIGTTFYVTLPLLNKR
jgi:two-component system nitrogen regulation sensor histidine kinase NtrY